MLNKTYISALQVTEDNKPCSPIQPSPHLGSWPVDRVTTCHAGAQNNQNSATQLTIGWAVGELFWNICYIAAVAGQFWGLAVWLVQKRSRCDWTQLSYGKRSTTKPVLQTSGTYQQQRKATATPWHTRTHAHSRSILCPHMVVLVTASALLCTHLTDVYESSSFGIQIRSREVLQFWNTKKRYLKKKEGKNTERSRCLCFKILVFTDPLFPTTQTYMDTLNHIPQSGSGAD